MTTLTQLQKELESGARTDTWTYGVEVDDQVFLHGTTLKSVALLGRLDGPSNLADEVVDAAIQLLLDRVAVTVEVPHQAQMNVRDLVTEVANLQIGLSLLPPAGDADDSEWQAYEDNLAAAVHAYWEQRNLETVIFPVSGFIEYMVGEYLGAAPPEVAEVDAYTQVRFAEPVPQARADSMKARMRSAVYEALGGEQGFAQQTNTVLYAMVERLSDMVEEVKARHRPTQLPEPARQHLLQAGALRPRLNQVRSNDAATA